MAKRSPDAPMIDLPKTLVTVPAPMQADVEAKRTSALAWIAGNFTASQRRLQHKARLSLRAAQ
ncbi:MAG: hypothetical protein AAFR07_05750 [Pseudomonadota bacterium]